MNLKTLLIVALLVSTTLTALAVVPPAKGATVYLNDQLVEAAGYTPALGGGDYRFVRFGSDAAFGVIWGNATHANNVYIVAIKARYIGVGQVYNQSGQLLVANRPIKIFTLYAAQLQDIVEYKDVTGDGVANYTRTYNATTQSYSNYASTGDNLYKLVNLSANWVPGTVATSTGSTYRSWGWNLTATNLAYYNISNKAKLTGALPLVRFTFHLNASLVQYDNVSIPQWNVTVGSQNGGRYTITNLVRMADLTLPSAKVVHYDMKWDQLIQGWSYANGNNPASSRGLLLEIGTIVGNYVPADVVMGWKLLHDLGDDGRARYNTTAGPQTADNATGALSAPQAFRNPNLDFGGNWTRIARFLWTTNSTVDNTTKPVYGQIEGGWAFVAVGERGNVFGGFVLLIGINFAGGNQIIHDPTVTSDVTTDLQFPAAPGSPTPTPERSLLGAVILGIVAIVAVALLAYLIVTRRRKEQPPAQPPMTPPSPPQP